MARVRESDLYGPVKAYLESQGYTVRGEVMDCDLVAVRGDDLVIVELKAAFNLELLLQGIRRQSVTDAVYLTVPAPRRGAGSRRWAGIRGLCRRLGLGLILVHLTASPAVQVLCDPESFRPRPSPRMRGRLLGEFGQRSGDHNTGGTSRRPIVTAYREEALRIAAFLAAHGTERPAAIRSATGVDRAGDILRRNYYGWFERVGRGLYRLSPAGKEALAAYADVVGGSAGPAASPAAGPAGPDAAV